MILSSVSHRLPTMIQSSQYSPTVDLIRSYKSKASRLVLDIFFPLILLLSFSASGYSSSSEPLYPKSFRLDCLKLGMDISLSFTDHTSFELIFENELAP